MKKFISFVAVVVLFALTQTAMAYYTVAIYQGSYSYSNGGEFAVDTSPSGPGGLGFVLPYYAASTQNQMGIIPSFQTFCVETNVEFSPGQMYNALISNQSDPGSLGSPIPLTVGAANLYYQFAMGTLANYNFSNSGGTRSNDAANLQQAIWMLQGQVAQGSNPFLDAIIGSGKTYATFAAAQAANNGAFPVADLDLYVIGSGAPAQDQLVLTPIPAAVWLLGTGLLGLVGIRRRFQK